MSNRQIAEFIAQAKPLVQSTPPFEKLPSSSGSRWKYGLSAADLRGAAWLKPLLGCQVPFTEWTEDRHLRHPAFQGFRDGKPAQEVVREW